LGEFGLGPSRFSDCDNRRFRPGERAGHVVSRRYASAFFAYRFIWRSHLGNVPLLFLAGRVATLHMKAYSGIDV